MARSQHFVLTNPAAGAAGQVEWPAAPAPPFQSVSVNNGTAFDLTIGVDGPSAVGAPNTYTIRAGRFAVLPFTGWVLTWQFGTTVGPNPAASPPEADVFLSPYESGFNDVPIAGAQAVSTQIYPADVYFKSGRPWYDVVAFGADPTGVKDSTVAIQAAISAARALPGIVFLPPGTYLVGELDLTGIASGIVFAGAGMDAVTIKPNASTRSVIDASASTSLELRDFTVGVGASAAIAPTTGIQCLATAAIAPSIRMRNVRITGTWLQAGLYCYGNTEDYFENVLVTQFHNGAQTPKTTVQCAAIHLTSSNAAALISDFITVAVGVKGGDGISLIRCSAIDAALPSSNVGILLNQVHKLEAIDGQYFSNGTACILLCNQPDTVTFIGPYLGHPAGGSGPTYIILSGGFDAASAIGVQTFGLTVIDPYIGSNPTSAIIGLTGPAATHGGWLPELFFRWLNVAGLPGTTPILLSETTVTDNANVLTNPFLYCEGLPITAGQLIAGGFLFQPGTVTMLAGTDQSTHVPLPGGGAGGQPFPAPLAAGVQSFFDRGTYSITQVGGNGRGTQAIVFNGGGFPNALDGFYIIPTDGNFYLGGAGGEPFLSATAKTGVTLSLYNATAGGATTGGLWYAVGH